MKTEPVIANTEDLDSVQIDSLSLFKSWNMRFEFDYVSGHGDGWYVRCLFDRHDIRTGKLGTGCGRSELISQGSTISSAVKTLWVLVKMLVEHEIMEAFMFQGARIFNPHHSVFELATLQSNHEK